MDFVENYILGLRNTRHSGAAVDETAHYGALQNLLNEIGKTLKPKVHCIIALKNQGAGLPDGGLFTPDQIRKQAKTGNVFDQIPARGAIEVKGTKDDVDKIADSKQVKDYLGRYGLVLVTNYRDFLLLERGNDDKPVRLERFSLADNEQDFWAQTAHPRTMADRHGERFSEYLKRVMQQAAPLTEPKDLAWFLASYARDAKARVEAVKDLAALNAVRASLEEALGLQFVGEKGEHFFRSTLVQTLFYGLFSAWVLWSKEKGHSTKDHFNWRMAQWSLHVPMIRALFEQVSTPSQLGPLELEEVMNWAGEVLNRVKREEFFVKFKEEHAVQYFYEPFLEAFDPELRKELGVWYTPPEIVKYMVERVDRVLREELRIPDGLADPNVYVLDPCCGTGAYLVETLRRIEETLRQKGDDGLIGHDVKQAAMKRVFGFEILPAPFVVAHLQLGVLLQNLGAQLSDEKNERAGVYLTNALTGWEPPTEPKMQLAFHELEEEREAAAEVKREKPVLVVIGNPPYNAFAGISPKEEQGLVDVYKEGLISKWGIKKFNLDDLYVRFFRLAERRIAEMTGKGVVCFISNHSWVSEPSFVVLRQHLLESFDKFWIENMHGNRKISEYAPDGRTSETVFAIQGFSPGIQQGVAISLWLKSKNKDKSKHVVFRDDLNDAKASDRREQLLETLNDPNFEKRYEQSMPDESNRYSFRPEKVSKEYKSWVCVSEIPEQSPSLGILENRRDALIDTDYDLLKNRMITYFDESISMEQLAAMAPGIAINAARFNARLTRDKVISIETFSSENIRRATVRPMDTRWCFYNTIRPLWNEPRPSYAKQCWKGNGALVTRRRGVAAPEGVPFNFISTIGLQHALHTDAYYFPILFKNGINKESKNHVIPGFINESEVVHANLSLKAFNYLSSIGLASIDDWDNASSLWMHVLAIGYSPNYLVENADGIKRDWPRIPLPNSRELLIKSAELGKKIAALLDTESDVAGVTSGEIRPELKKIGGISGAAGGQIDPGAGDLRITAGWGHGGKDGVTMPGKGKIERRAFGAEESDCNLPLLGDETLDVYLNDKAYWKNIPARVWDYHIGGYQVIKKWLSYREYVMLGRDLKPEEAREVMNMARRIAAIILLEPELDKNYAAVKENCYSWKGNTER
ncbi:MAG: N-6 DNA methylase [Armatimonadetes bacterium]|nr:N-6 DNA methylase [Armatimonadota bacterium]